MSKVITHTRNKIADIKKGHSVRTKGSGFTQGDTGYDPKFARLCRS